MAEQLELFDDIKSVPKTRHNSPILFPHRFVRLRVAYEDLICGVLILALLLLGGFCLGVERGKGLQVGKPASVFENPWNPPGAGDQAGRTAPSQTYRTQVASAISTLRSKELIVAPTPAPRDSDGPYVIQLASYVGEAAARAEAARLRRQGLNAEIVKSGRFYELRVCGYRTRDQAASTLASLRKTYHDGFVKRISS